MIYSHSHCGVIFYYEQIMDTQVEDAHDEKVNEDRLFERNRRLKNKVISLQASNKKKGKELRNMKRRGV